MISARAAALTAVGASFAALFVISLYVPALIVKIGEINYQVSEFRFFVIKDIVNCVFIEEFLDFIF